MKQIMEILLAVQYGEMYADEALHHIETIMTEDRKNEFRVGYNAGWDSALDDLGFE